MQHESARRWGKLGCSWGKLPRANSLSLRGSTILERQKLAEGSRDVCWCFLLLACGLDVRESDVICDRFTILASAAPWTVQPLSSSF